MNNLGGWEMDFEAKNLLLTNRSISISTKSGSRVTVGPEKKGGLYLKLLLLRITFFISTFHDEKLAHGKYCVYSCLGSGEHFSGKLCQFWRGGLN